MMEAAGRTAQGALAPGVIMTARRLIVVASAPANPVVVSPSEGETLEFVLRGVALTENASVAYQWEGDIGFLAPDTPLTGVINLTINTPEALLGVVTKPMSVGSQDRILLVTFSNVQNATWAGDSTYTVLLKAENASAQLNVKPDSYVVTRGTIDNVLRVLSNDQASAPIRIKSIPNINGLRIANDFLTLLYNAPDSIVAPFVTSYEAEVPTTGERASAALTLEVEDTFASENVSVNIPYNSSRTVDVLTFATPIGRVIVSAIGSPSDSNLSAELPDGGASIRVTVPRDADTPSSSCTLSYTLKHTRTNATINRTLTITYTGAQTGLLRGNPGPISKLPWYSGGTHNDFNKGNQSIEVLRGKKSDVVMTFGDRGKGDSTTAAEQWKSIRGGDVTGIGLQGVFLGIKWASGGAITNNSKIIPVITYDQWPFAYGKDNDAARLSRFQQTAAGTFATGIGTTDDVYDAFGAKLKRIVENYGWPAVVVRMNHECNGTDSYPHYIRNVSMLDPFIGATRRAITRIKAAAQSTQFELFFALNLSRNTNGSGMWGPDCWVGKQYCEILELDFYDRNPPAPIKDAATMNRYLNNTRGTSARWKMRDGVTPLPGCNGPRTWADFARQQGVGFAVGEWGVMMDNDHHPGAEGDNPVFIEGVWNFFNEISDVLWYECYFTQSDSALNLAPNSRAKYSTLWGA